MKLIRKTRSTPSQAVRKLTPRQPLPRHLGGRIVHFSGMLRYFPLAMAAGLLLLFLAVSFYRYVAHSRYFSLEVIRVDGSERLTKADVLALLREKTFIDVGSSTLSINCSDTEKDLESIPEIGEAIIEKRWPNGLEVTVIERQAVGIYVSRNSSLVYDEEGLLFAYASAQDFMNNKLPIVTGMDELPLERGASLPEPVFHQVTDYVRVFMASSPSLAARISELHSDSQSGLTLVLNDGVRFVCGTRPPESVGPIIESIMADSSLSHRIESANLFSDMYISITPRGLEPEIQVSQLN